MLESQRMLVSSVCPSLFFFSFGSMPRPLAQGFNMKYNLFFSRVVSFLSFPPLRACYTFSLRACSLHLSSRNGGSARPWIEGWRWPVEDATNVTFQHSANYLPHHLRLSPLLTLQNLYSAEPTDSSTGFNSNIRITMSSHSTVKWIADYNVPMLCCWL